MVQRSRSMQSQLFFLAVFGWLLWCGGLRPLIGGEPIVGSVFIYDSAPFPECHASTIVETESGLVSSWFGGTHEKHPDVCIWVSRHDDGKWLAPEKVADGVQDSATRFPCWNPVLYQPYSKPLLLFYKVGPSPSTWWGMVISSSDGGKTWSDARRLPDGMLGPIKNKPIGLPGGRILCGSSDEADGWQVHVESCDDEARRWYRTHPLNDREEFGAIQPTILQHRDDQLQLLCRSRQGVVTQCWSHDSGVNWTPMTKTTLPNPNSGIDGVTLADGRQLLVYNHTTRSGEFPRGREMLNVAISEDGVTWKAALTLEKQPGEYSYPAVIQAKDGLVHTTYTYRRQKVKHVTIDPSQLKLRDIVDGKWPTDDE